MKKLLAIVLVVISICIMVSACAEDKGEKYPKLTIVSDITPIAEKCYLVTCIDMQGVDWSFFCEYEDDWEKGDIANLLMWNMYGEDRDEIIEVYYEGHLGL